MINKIKDWVIKNRFEAFLLSSILILSAFLRLYKIDQFMTFLGDEGRDAIVVRRLLVNFDPILVGPGTSIGNMYLGPLYYYLIAPFLLLFNFSPVGPSVMIALLGILTVYFVWFAAREWFGKFGAFVSALLYATSPVIITYSRSSWNPNVMPFFAMLCIYSVWKVYKNFEFKWLLILGIAFTFVLNSHYLGLLLIPPLGLFWFLTILKVYGLPVTDRASAKRNFFTKSVFGLSLFVLLMSPLIIFDARHNWRNFEAIKTFFTVRQETVSIKPWTAIVKLLPIWEKILNRLVTAFNAGFASFMAAFTTIFTIAFLLGNFFKGTKKIFIEGKNNLFEPLFLVLVWIFSALIGFGLYKQEIYDHYYGFIFPAVFLLIGGIFQKFYNSGKFLGLLLAVVFLPLSVWVNLRNSPIKYHPNNQLGRSIEVAREIERLSNGREFNFAVIAERNYEGAYQYFFEKDGAAIVMIDPQKDKETVKDQLFVVCEMPEDKCDPVNNPKAGIANFGWSKIEFVKDFSGVKIYKLVHNKPQG